MEKLIGGTLIGALVGVLLSMLLALFGIHNAEWFLALGTVMGAFVGLLIMNEAEQPDGHGHNAHDAHGHADAHADADHGQADHADGGHGSHHGPVVDPAVAALQQERHERQRAAVAKAQDQVVTIFQDPSFKRAIASAVVGAFLILPFAVLLLIMGINKILWWVAAGAVMGAFIGLLKAVEDEQPQMAEAGHGGDTAHH